MGSLFEQARGICLDRAAVGGGLARELGLNLGCDVNGNRHVPSFQAMLLPYIAAVLPVNRHCLQCRHEKRKDCDVQADPPCPR